MNNACPIATSNLIAFFHPNRGGKGACTTVSDLQDYCLTSYEKQECVRWIREHNQWLYSSSGQGNRFRRRLEHFRWLLMNEALYGPIQ